MKLLDVKVGSTIRALGYSVFMCSSFVQIPLLPKHSMPEPSFHCQVVQTVTSWGDLELGGVCLLQWWKALQIFWVSPPRWPSVCLFFDDVSVSRRRRRLVMQS